MFFTVYDALVNSIYSCTIVMQTIKDVNQALVDDSLVDFDKVGSELTNEQIGFE